MRTRLTSSSQLEKPLTVSCSLDSVRGNSDIIFNDRLCLSVLYDLSVLLGTGLDRQTLALCVSMVEDGANPSALAVRVFSTLKQRANPSTGRSPINASCVTSFQTVVRELRKEAEARSAKTRPTDPSHPALE